MKHYPFSISIAIVIWVVCMIPIPETPLSEISFIDKWTHFVMYATFTLSILLEHQKCSKLSTLSSKLTIVVFAALMGCLVELAQAYLTTCRSGDWFDALCNTLGSLLGLAIFTVVLKVWKH